MGWKCFLMGLTLGLGSCLLFCGPIVLPYIAASQRGWKEGFKAILLFSFSRFIAYTLLGLVAAVSGKVLSNLFPQGSRVLSISGGGLVSILGIAIIFGQGSKQGLCHRLRCRLVDRRARSMLLLGLIIGFSPCLPLMGALSFIALNAEGWLKGALYGSSFGLGTIISPLSLLGPLAGILPIRMEMKPNFLLLFRRICGFLLFVFGARMVALGF